MAGLGLHFEGDFLHHSQRANQSSGMSRTKSMPAFHPQNQHSDPAPDSRYINPSAHDNNRVTRSEKGDQVQYAGYSSAAYIPMGHNRQNSVPMNPIPMNETQSSVTPQITFYWDLVENAAHSTASNAYVSSDHPPRSQHEWSADRHNGVEPSSLHMRRWQTTQERVQEKQQADHKQSLRPALSMNGLYEGYLGAGMIAAAMRPPKGPPSLDLLRAIALHSNSPRANSSDSNEPFTPPSSTFQTGTPNSPSRLPAFLKNRQCPSSRDGLSPVTPASSTFQRGTPNSPSRLPPFLQNRQNSAVKDTLTPVSASPHPFASAPNSPLNPRRTDIPARSENIPGFNLQMPPSDRQMLKEAKAAAQAAQQPSGHRTMRSMNDLASLYDYDQCHHHYKLYMRLNSLQQFPSRKHDDAPIGMSEPPILPESQKKSHSRSWTVENLFDCPDLTSTPQPARPTNSSHGNTEIRDPHEASQGAGKIPSAQSSSGLCGANVKVSQRLSRSRRDSEPREMQRSKSEGSGLNLSCSLARRGTLMTVGGDSVKRSRDLSRLLAPSEANSNEFDDVNDEPRSTRGSRPSTACSNYPYEQESAPRKAIKEVDNSVVSLEGSKPARKARVELELLLDSSLIVEGGNLTGRIEVKVPHHNDTSNRKTSKEVWLGEPKIRIIGFEELSTSDARHVFYHYPVTIPMQKKNESKKSKSAVNLLAIKDDPVDDEGFRQGRSGVHVFPFRIRLPVGKGAKGTWKGKQGNVRYIVIGSIKLKSSCGGDRSIAHFYRHVEFYPYFDPIKTLAPSPHGLKVTTSKGLFMAGQGKVHLTAKLHRSIWVAGQRCYVDVHVGNDGSKKIKSLTLALIRTTTVFRTKPHPSDSDGDCQRDDDLTKHPDFCSTQTTKKKIAESVLTMGKKGQQGLVTAKGLWMGVDKGEDVAFSHFLLIPSEALTITRGRRLEVTYTIKVSVGGSLSSDVSVDIPIKVINFVSIDPPPGHVTHLAEDNSPAKSHSLVLTHSSSMQDISSHHRKKETVFRSGRGQAHLDHLDPHTHDASDLEELQLFMGSSRFPEDCFPETFDQILQGPRKLHQRHKSEGVLKDPTLRSHKTQPHQTSDSIKIIDEFPLPPPSRIAFEDSRIEKRTGKDRPIYRSGYQRASSRARCVGGKEVYKSTYRPREYEL
ncbi:hypothetical protein CROQUDRAFT_654998 [Cronartium quercuum f. sp. fusiforme G11]|uniref:Arrestin C-terminal-like domain-containing protein n=1 Tax=Cronartium quercuum f. sp. fusiforme G11 TaxID=708437 RepID=A0A9P6NLN5_9BASI|nr:hypothetical protein CROQUDRAFT_654998 [Cronartium quercuum f. sp. fusiforme G11]